MSTHEPLFRVRDYRLAGHDEGDAGRPARPDFSRLTSFAPAGLVVPAPAPMPALLEPESGGTAVSAKSFIGPNATYYDDRWRWMHWRGRSRSWNWAAALSLGGWLAYRRMGRPSLIYGGWLGLLIVLALAGAPIAVLALAQVAVMLGLGLYGNTLYFHHYMRVAEELSQTHREHDELSAAARRAGGVDPVAVWRYASGIAGVVLLALMAWQISDADALGF